MVVVVGGNVLHHVKREGELSRAGNVRGNMSGEYVLGKCPDPLSRQGILCDMLTTGHHRPTMQRPWRSLR